MQHLSKLLEIEKSNLAWVLRLGLQGLRAQLEEARNKEARNKDARDPGMPACEELLRELDMLLEPAFEPVPLEESKETASPSEEESSLEESSLEESSLEENEYPFDPVPPPPEELKLSRLRESLIEDQKLSEYVGKVELSDSKDAILWNEVQRLLLRVPEREADSWRTQAINLAKEVGFSITEAKKSLIPLPLIGNFSQDKQVIYPGIKVNGNDKVGLYWSERQGFDLRLAKEKLEGELNLLAGVVYICLKFIEIDSNLNHALKSVERFRVISLNEESQKDRYSTALIDRFGRAITADKSADPVKILRGRLDLDEAIHSLVYYPPADRFSWWGKLQQQARDTLQQVAARARQAGHQVQVRSLWGSFANVSSRSKDDLELDSGGTPGEVSACLRVYAKIDEEVLPGRVLFRSLR
ncbi:MAG: hypothetical protein GDA56_18730 [Hormoscilla sp. GM7CHS1pb]|nr:hypothetical protein [Hormoscilla sp. GM7CHS1pb]